MYWPLKTPAVAESAIPILNSYYLKACPTPSDPTMVWGTDVEIEKLNGYLRAKHADSPVLISGAHVLLRAVAEALVRYPQFNRRVLGKRLYRFRDVNILMPLRKRRQGEAGVFLLRNADSYSISEIAQQVLQHNRNAARGEHVHDRQTQIFRRIPRWIAGPLLRLQLWSTNHFNHPVDDLNEQLCAAPVLVNYLSFNGAAPMRSFKPSRFPSECWTLSVTMGPGENRPVADGNRVVVKPVSTLFVRADHRIVDAYELGKFVGTLQTLLSDPWLLDSAAAPRKEKATFPAIAGRLADGQFCRWPR